MLGKIHFYIGILIIIIFLLTGQYMSHLQMSNYDSMNRALFRAGHLYILLFGLINVSLGINFKISDIILIKINQSFGSIIIFSASFLVIYGFLTELPTKQLERPLTKYSLYLILLGVSIHGLIYLVKNKKTNR